MASFTSCSSSNLQNAPPTSSTVLNNQCEKDAAATAVKDGRDFKRIHFSLETLNTRRLLARLASDEQKVGGANAKVGGRCENGVPLVATAPSLASLLRSLPSAPPIPATSSQSHVAPVVEPSPVVVAPPRPGELLQLQQEIEEMRERLRVALARRAELQTSVTTPTRGTLATISAVQAPPTATTASAKSLPADTKCQSQQANQRT